MNVIVERVDRLGRTVGAWIPEALVMLALRLALFFVFWPSVQNKLAGPAVLGQKWQFWNIADSTFLLFSFEYQLPLLSSRIAAWLGTLGEFWLSLLILTGFLTRFGALGLLAITAVIQIFVYPEAWKLHLTWAAACLALLRYGGGTLSVDRLVRGRR